MRIVFAFRVRFVDSVSGFDVAVPSVVPDCLLSEDTLDVSLDARIADEGVVGGSVSLARTNTGQPAMEVRYWHPGIPDDRLVDSLRANPVSQLEDGLGEGGFPFDCGGTRFLVIAETEDGGTVEVTDDGCAVAEPNGIAIAARDGDLALLVEELKAAPSDIDRWHQGCPPLHLALLYGHAEAVPLLLAAGANPNVVDAQGNTPLEVCALTNRLDDGPCRDLAEGLLEAGADPFHRAPDGESARTYAQARQKKLLAATLSSGHSETPSVLRTSEIERQ